MSEFVFAADLNPLNVTGLSLRSPLSHVSVYDQGSGARGNVSFHFRGSNPCQSFPGSLSGLKA